LDGSLQDFIFRVLPDAAFEKDADHDENELVE
jgi:hypothetical protein